MTAWEPSFIELIGPFSGRYYVLIYMYLGKVRSERNTSDGTLSKLPLCEKVSLAHTKKIDLNLLPTSYHITLHMHTPDDR